MDKNTPRTRKIMQTWPAECIYSLPDIRRSRCGWRARFFSVPGLRGGAEQTLHLFDPCCGAGLTISSVIAYLHGIRSAVVICSDIDEKAVQLAERTWACFTPAGMEPPQPGDFGPWYGCTTRPPIRAYRDLSRRSSETAVGGAPDAEAPFPGQTPPIPPSRGRAAGGRH